MTELKWEETETHRVQAGGKTSHELSAYELFIVQVLAGIQNDITKIKKELGIES